MKLKRFLILAVFSGIFFISVKNSVLYAQAAEVSEITVYNEAFSYFQAGYFPGAVERIDFLEEHYPESVFIVPALQLKSEALIKLGRFEEAVEACNTVIPTMHFGSEGLAKCYYLLGKANYCLGEFDAATDAFHNVCVIEVKEEKLDYYNPAILLSGKIFFMQQKYEEAVAPFEYVVANGKIYAKEDYQEVLQKLFIVYNNCGLYEKSTGLYERLVASDIETQFPDEVYSLISMNAAEAYEKNQEYKKSYDLYSKLIQNDNFNVVVTALKKAYIISSKYNLNVNPADVLEKIKLSNNKDSNILGEFWTRLGIDAYNQKNFVEAMECFDSAENYCDKNILLIGQIYRWKIQLEEAAVLIQSEKKEEIEKGERKLQIVFEQLQESKEEILKRNITGMADSYTSALLYAYFLKKDYEIVEKLAGEIENPDSLTNYLTAVSLYKSRRFSDCEDFLLNYFETTKNQKNALEAVKKDEFLKLYASVLAKRKKLESAREVYSQLDKNNKLDNSNKFEYAKVLYSLKNYSEAEKQSLEANVFESDYLAALCNINLGNYSKAKQLLEKYRKENGYNEQAFFYEAYASYKSGDYKVAYRDFVTFAEKYSYSSLKNKAYEYGAKASVFLGDLDKAAISAEKMVDNSKNETEKFAAIVFCADIYTDNKKYEDAIRILLPYSEKNNQNTLKALFQLGTIFEKADLSASADEFYQKVFNLYPESKEAEEALFRSGEVFYSAGKLEEAENRFTKYIYNYVDGKFSDAAYYFCGNCNLKLQNYDRSIMQNKNLIQHYTQSNYVYGAYKNLLTAYYAVENYESALEVAKKLNQKYQKQTEIENLNINEKIRQLELIIGGTDVRLVELLSEFENSGKTQTKQGRIAGTKLVQLYDEIYDFSENTSALDLAMELLPLQNSEDEKQYGAQNADFIAKYYTTVGKSQEAAEMYLKAAEYYRSSADLEVKAAAALYSAVSSFVSSDLIGDAQATADLLVKLYPETKQAKKVYSLLK